MIEETDQLTAAVASVGGATRLLAKHGGPWSDLSAPPPNMVTRVAARLLDDDTAVAVEGLYNIAVKRHEGDAAALAQLAIARDVVVEARRLIEAHTRLRPPHHPLPTVEDE